jgi:hypothetical protein
MKIRRTNKKQSFKKKFMSRKLKFNRNRKTSKISHAVYKSGGRQLSEEEEKK